MGNKTGLDSAIASIFIFFRAGKSLVVPSYLVLSTSSVVQLLAAPSVLVTGWEMEIQTYWDDAGTDGNIWKPKK